MGDTSQSRYSIVERLTAKKLEIMTNKSDLADEIKDREFEVQSVMDELANWKKDINHQKERTEREFDLRILATQKKLENAKERLKEKEKVFDEQMNAVEEALKSIESISKSAAIQEKQ